MAYTGNTNIHNGKVGKIGEDFACEYLIAHGHTILERNYHLKMGEIDIVTRTTDPRGSEVKIHIVEVKTSQSLNVRAVENMNSKKMKKVALLAQAYCKNVLYCIDFIGVDLNSDFSLKNITYLENIEIY